MYQCRSVYNNKKVGAFRVCWTKTAWKVSKYGPEITPYLDTFHAVEFHIIVVCKVKPKIPREWTELDYVIPGYSLHPVNLDLSIRRGIIIYIHFAIDNCVIQINPDINHRTDINHKTDFNSMIRQLVLSNWTEKFVIQNQSKSVDELWSSFKSEIH